MVFTPGRFAGTPMYMAPEILKEQVPDARCDLFSLGITAYQLLTGRLPYSHTTRLSDLLVEKLDQIVEFPADLQDSIPLFMREAVRKLCALQSEDRFASAQEFLDSMADESIAHSISAKRTAHRLERSSLVGREQELQQVLGFAHARLLLHDKTSGALLCLVSAPSGMGKSRLLAETRTILQSEGHVFLQGDAYDQDVGEYTALAPILLAASHLTHAQEAVDLIYQHGSELVKIVPEFGLPLVCKPSPAFSNGAAERERLITEAAAFLVELAQRRPLAIYLNDLQWAGEGTIQVLREILKRLRAQPASRLALLISYRSDEVQGRPIEPLLSELPPAAVETVGLQGFSAEQVGAVMSSMMLSTVSLDVARAMQQATAGVPFLIEESTRWLVHQGTLTVKNGACSVNTQSGELELHVEIGKGILARAALQGPQALYCLKLLSVCARPIELEHLRHAMGNRNAPAQDGPEPPADLERVLGPLEAEQFVVAVAGNRPRYALAHDRIRESIFESLSPDEQSQIHGCLGEAFEAYLFATNAAELAVLSAVHQNATPIPQDASARTRRCDVNLRAAEVAFQVADFAQALAFLDAAEGLLAPDIWADHVRGMRLTYQRAQIFAAMRRLPECIDSAKQAIRHARTRVEEGMALVLAIRALILLRRYREAIDACVDFCNRLDPQAKLPRHPNLASILGDVISLSRQIERAGAGAILSRIHEPEDPERDLLHELIAITADAVYLGEPKLFAKLMRHWMDRLLRKGASVRSLGAVISNILAVVVVLGAAGKIELAIEVGNAARRLLDSVPLEAKGRAMHVFEQYVRHLDQPLRISPPIFLSAASHCQQVRDTAYEGYARLNHAIARDWLGEPLDQVNDTYTKLENESVVETYQELRDWIRVWQRLRATLQGQGDSGGQTAAEAVVSKGAKASQIAVKLRGAALGVWPGPWKAAEYGFPALLGMNQGRAGCHYESIAYFCAGLVYLAALRGMLPLLDRLHFRAAAEFVTSHIRKRARYNPADYAHRLALLDAEHLRNRRELARAVPLYENAARLAKQSGWSNESALILEKFTEVLVELGEMQRARATANECILLYRHWQAWIKVEQMERFAAVLKG